MSQSAITFKTNTGEEMSLPDLMSLFASPDEFSEIMGKVVSVTAAAASQADYGTERPFFSFQATVLPGVDNPVRMAAVLYQVAKSMCDEEINKARVARAAGGPQDQEFAKPKPTQYPQTAIRNVAAPSSAAAKADAMPRPPKPGKQLNDTWKRTDGYSSDASAVWTAKITKITMDKSDKANWYELETENSQYPVKLFARDVSDQQKVWFDNHLGRPIETHLYAVIVNSKTVNATSGKPYKNCIGVISDESDDEAIVKLLDHVKR